MNLKHTFRALYYRNYRLFFVGQGISLIGTWMQRIALAWLVYRMTNSAIILGTVGFASQIPTFMFAPLAGVVADRRNRYHIIIITQVLAMLQALVLAILVLMQRATVWHLVVLSIVLGIINAFEIPARQAFVVTMVERKEDLLNAIALNSSIFNGARLIGPSIAGILIAVVGEGLCFLLNSISFIAVIAALLAMKVGVRANETKQSHVLEELKNGFAYAFGFAPIRSVILLLALVSLVAMPYTVLMPVFAKEILHGGSRTLGLLMAGTGVGALIGAMFLASRKTAQGLENIIPLSAGVFGIGLIALSLSRGLSLSLIFTIIAGFGMMVQLASSNTTLQTIVEEDKRARVMSFYAMSFMGAVPLGSLLAGSLAERIGTPYTILSGGICCVIGALLFSRKMPMRAMIRELYAKVDITAEVASGINTTTTLTKPPEV